MLNFYRNAAAILFFLGLPLAGQFTSASLNGIVKDSSGSVVPNAKVSVANTETGFTRTDTAASDGAFLFPVLPVGTYKLTVEKDGFSTYVQTGIILTVNQAASQTVTLQLGSTTQQVVVTANAAMVNTQTALVSQLVSQKQVIDLPLNGRTAQSLVFVAAGTANTTNRYCGYNCQGGVYPTEQEASVNGGGTANVNYQMDGAGHNDSFMNMNLPFPNPDAIQEFNLQSSNMSAEYGNSAAVVNIVTKSGTNAFHGDAFEFLRNGDMNARNFFAPTQDTLKRNQFGGTIGGPIKKDQLFFFGTYQGTRVRSAPAGRVSFVPTAGERNGDYSATTKQLINPDTNAPFPGNQIPVSLFASPAKYFLGKIPLPNGPGEQLTYQGPAAKQSENQFMPKVDWVRGKNQLSGRFFYTKYTQPPDTTQVKQNLLAMDPNANEVRVATVSLNHVYSATPSLLFNTWFGWNSQVGGSRSGDPTGADALTYPAAGVKIAGGAPGAPAAIEALNIGGYFNLQSGHFGNFDRGDWRIREVVTVEKGSHEVIFGGEVIRLRQDIANTNTQSGVFRFLNQLSGSNFVDFLLGDATNFQQGAGQYQDVRATEFSFFVQDNWRLSQRLVLNLGVRWDPFFPYQEIKNRVPCFAPGQKSQRYPNAPLGLIFGGDAGCPSGSGYDSSTSNLAPRAGFAYRINEKTVLRGGAGIYYTLPQTSQVNGTAATAPFSPRFLLTRVRLEDPYGSAGIANPFPSQYGGGSLPGPDFQFTLPVQISNNFARDFRLPTLGAWNMKLERQVGANWLLSGSYTGNGGYHLSSNQNGTREANPAIYIPGASTVGNTQARRRVQGISTASLFTTDYNSHYHALQLNAEKRFNVGVSLLANYTWSKTIDDYAAGGTSTNPFNRNFDHGLSLDDVPHIFHFTAVWALPGPKSHGPVSRLLKGWELTSITTWQSGFPFSVFSGLDNSFSGVGSDRADFTGTSLSQARLSGLSHAQEIQKFFATSLFAPNAIGSFGNSGKNILRGPRLFDTDLGLIKDTNITERTKVQFRAEFFNVFNNVNFGNPGSTFGNPGFGKITSASDPRILQLSLKLVF